MEVSEGQVLAAKYRVERVLGRGGMGLVVAAHHIQLDEKVAIKFLLPEAVGNPDVVGRFVREARAAVRIKSEHVARVSDVGTLEGGEPYMVMEYLEGADLAVWLQQQGTLPIEQAVEFVLQAGEAIAEAHALGIVHRDLKPANLFVVRRADGLWSVKVLDFGISKVTTLGASGPDVNFTRTSAVIGSPLYMPPEQMAASKTVDARADIWALGVVLYELITGQAPFAGETLPEVCMKIAVEAPSAIRRIRPDVPQALEAVILRCLEKDRERRYRNVAELAQALIPFGPKRARNSVERISRTIQAAGLSQSGLVQSPSSDRREDLPAATVAAAGAGTDAPWGRTAGASRNRKRPVVLLSVLVAAALGALVLGVRHSLSSPTPTLASASTTPAEGSSAQESPLFHAQTDIPRPLAASATSSAVAPPATQPRIAPSASAAVVQKRPSVSAVMAPVPKPARSPTIFDDR